MNRTILRPTSLPAPTITLKTQTPLTKREAIQAFDAVLALNGVAMINVGEKFVKAVPAPTANHGTSNAAGAHFAPSTSPTISSATSATPTPVDSATMAAMERTLR